MTPIAGSSQSAAGIAPRSLRRPQGSPRRVGGVTGTDAKIDIDALVEFTRELVRIPSVFDPDRGLNEAPAAELVEAQMRAFGWEPQVDLAAEGRPNVIAVIDGDAPGRTLMFEGHTDV